MIRIYKLPQKLTNGYCFGGGHPIEFLNVDWFDGTVPALTGSYYTASRDELEAEVKRKKYYDPAASFLVLGDAEDQTFVIRAVAKDNVDREIQRRVTQINDILRAAEKDKPAP